MILRRPPGQMRISNSCTPENFALSTSSVLAAATYIYVKWVINCIHTWCLNGPLTEKVVVISGTQLAEHGS
jgi:hypothetical protein